MRFERVTITLPLELVKRIDDIERNRSQFVTAAVRNELSRQGREPFLMSLNDAHRDAGELTMLGLDDWATGFPPEDEGIALRDVGDRARWFVCHGWFREPE